MRERVNMYDCYQIFEFVAVGLGFDFRLIPCSKR